jgi:hypothetical protein
VRQPFNKSIEKSAQGGYEHHHLVPFFGFPGDA